MSISYTKTLKVLRKKNKKIKSKVERITFNARAVLI